MYIYYEIFKDADPTKTVTEIVLSTDGRWPRVDFKNKAEFQIMQLLGAKAGLFGQVPIEYRMGGDAPTYVWTFIGHYGQVLITGIESFINQGLFQNVVLKEIKDLSSKVLYGTLNKIDKDVKPEELKYKEEDFFYSAPAGTNEPTGAVLIEKLSILLNVSIEILTNENDDKALKRLYRTAALRYHPDRNNGDGSKMSELNMLWNLFMQKA